MLRKLFQRHLTSKTFHHYNFTSIPQKEDKKEPKWMKFFKDSTPLLIDLERSIKSDNRMLLQNYIKTSFTQFNLQQLILSLPNVHKSEAFLKII
jgi:hypothetical protein